MHWNSFYERLGSRKVAVHGSAQGLRKGRISEIAAGLRTGEKIITSLIH